MIISSMMKVPVFSVAVESGDLLVSHINYMLANFAEHSEKFSHDALNRSLDGEKLSPKLTWENVQNQVIRIPICMMS